MKNSYTPSPDEVTSYGCEKMKHLTKNINTNVKHMSASQLKQLRNWTDTFITSFLSNPTLQPIGPRKTAVVSWPISAILEAEKTTEFQMRMQERFKEQLRFDITTALSIFTKEKNKLLNKHNQCESDLLYLHDLIHTCEKVLLKYPILNQYACISEDHPQQVLNQTKQQFASLTKDTTPSATLRPSVTNSRYWHPERLPRTQWENIRKLVLYRDNYTCQFCSHRASMYMNVHHVADSSKNELRDLITCCVACHAVLHIGRNINLGKIEIWETEMSQLEIIKQTREGISKGLTLNQINASFQLSKGPYEPGSIDYANSLITSMGNKARAELPPKLCAIFIDFKRWQIE